MKKYYKVLLFVLLAVIITCVVACIVAAAIWMYKLDLLEMNAQIQQFGFYKKDVVILKYLYWDNIYADSLMGVGMCGLFGLCGYLVYIFLNPHSWIYE